MRIILLILLAMSPNAFAEKFSSFDALVGKELMADNGWAGESFTLERKDKKFVVCHTIFGSGVPIVSKTSYPVSQLGELDYSHHQISKLIMVGDSLFNTPSLDGIFYTFIPVPVAPKANPASPTVLILIAAAISLSQWFLHSGQSH